MAELAAYLLCGVAGLVAGAAVGLGVGWVLGVPLFDRGWTGGETDGPATTTAAKVLMGVGSLLGAPGVVLLCLLAKARGW
jgi:hypothetical protein